MPATEVLATETPGEVIDATFQIFSKSGLLNETTRKTLEHFLTYMHPIRATEGVEEESAEFELRVQHHELGEIGPPRSIKFVLDSRDDSIQFWVGDPYYGQERKPATRLVINRLKTIKFMEDESLSAQFWLRGENQGVITTFPVHIGF